MTHPQGIAAPLAALAVFTSLLVGAWCVVAAHQADDDDAYIIPHEVRLSMMVLVPLFTFVHAIRAAVVEGYYVNAVRTKHLAKPVVT